SHGVGNTGFATFLKLCNCEFVLYFNENAMENYSLYYNKLVFENKKYLYLAIREYSLLLEKFYKLIICDKSICLVRDPVSVLKHHLNYKWLGENYLSIVDFGVKFDKILHNRVGYINKSGIQNIPSFEGICKILNNISSYYHDFLLKNNLSYVKLTYFLDMKDIVGDRAFETIYKLSNTFNFKNPDERDKDIFESNISIYGNLLPISINMKKIFNCKEDIIISIIDKNRKVFFLNSNVCIEHVVSCCSLNFSFIIKNEQYKLFIEYIRDNEEILLKIRNYLCGLVVKIDEQKEIENKKKL
ncbi:TPA: DUF2972 domain-containing protein, partial [Campylobacter jejuni]|nr:DUF2972 domain-containing protein [Campylobacter jejuni]HEG6281674.1 DUF2972 domain-containing protein [Campylobacter jejuni]